MLITMDTLTRADLAAWEAQQRYDLAIGRSPAHQRRAARAVAEIRAFHDTHPDCVCSTSWGKDSVVVAHLARLADPTIPIVWVPTIRADGISYESESSYQVRDTFLRAWPGTYEERPAVAINPKRGDTDWTWDQYDQPDYHSQDVLKDNISEPYISGVRAEESAVRTMSIGHHGTTTRHTCRPIGKWQATDVFAHLAANDLPIHPAYAATIGGTLDRRWLRVHPLRSKPPTRSAVHDRDMYHWEDTYFPTLTEHRKWND